jgi:5-methyltetrahydrofolate--homocysteine methyltransferase
MAEAQTELLKQLSEAVVTMDIEEVKAKCEEAIAAGVPAPVVIRDGLSAGMRQVGEMWNRMEVYMPEVMGSVDAYYAGLDLMKKQVTGDQQISYVGTIVMGTIWGDIHSVGKDVAGPVFEGAEFKVIDLGLDVSPERYIEAIKEYKPDIVGLGTYMSETFLHVKDTVDAFVKAGVRDQVYIVCGGPAVDSEVAKKMGADEAYDDAWVAVAGMKELIAKRD